MPIFDHEALTSRQRITLLYRQAAKLNYTLALGHVKKSEVRRQLEAMQDLITNILMDLRWGDLSDG